MSEQRTRAAWGKRVSAQTVLYGLDLIKMSLFQSTGSYELLNYSEFGSEVDGVLYCTSASEAELAERPSQRQRSLRTLLPEGDRGEEEAAVSGGYLDNTRI